MFCNMPTFIRSISRMYLCISRVSILLALTFGVIYCSLQIVPERVEVYYKHSDFMQNLTLKIRRYGRRSPYYLVGQGIIKQTWNNNVTMHLETYEYLHNEYRLSFMTMKAKLCDFINKDMFLGPIFRKHDFTCPMKAGEVVFSNMTFYWEKFPYLFPITKGLANITVRKTDTNELLVGAHFYASVKQIRQKST